MIPFRFALGAAFVAVSTTMAAADCAEHLALMASLARARHVP